MKKQEVTETLGEILTLKLLPNPASNQVKLLINGTEKGDYDIQFFDILGRKVFEQRRFLEQGQNQIEVFLEGFNRGHYLVRITNGTQELVEKLLIEY